MKARIKATGDVVDIIRYPYESKFYKKDDPIMNYRRDELEFIEDSIDWEQRRFELVKAAMQGYITSEGAEYTHTENQFKNVAELSIGIADAVLAEYKKGCNK